MRGRVESQASHGAAGDFFVAGGTLRPDAPSYVTRPADDELFDRALRGEFCYVLTPRQMGKSSLMARTARRLQEQGVSTAVVDLTRIGVNVTTPDQWYLSLLTQLQRQLRLTVDPVAWWRERAGLTNAQRLTDFLRDVVLTEIEGRVVIFIDEIDSTLGLDFRDDFFAAIRATYNARATDPAFERLTFVLLGVAAPTDLISDQARTPFNVGQGIGLGEFSRVDAAVLQAGLEEACPGQGAAIFDRIYHWTGGHPYLTQKLCLAVAEAGGGRWTDERVDHLVEDLFLTEEARSEGNLKFVQSNILEHPRRSELLKLYRQVLREGARGVEDDGQSPLHNRLKLSGIVRAENGRLRVRNRIYRSVFDRAWVREHTAVNWAPIVAGVMGFVALLAVGALLYNAWVGIRVSRCVDDFYQTAAPEERVANLARIFRAQGLFGPSDYDYRARELFYGLTAAEQEALFDARGVAEADLMAVVRGLYVMGGETLLLEGMRNALGRLEGAAGEGMREEIGHWLRGRELAEGEAYGEARTAYDSAVGLNGDNPATRYERAVVLVALSEYGAALNDLERVVAAARSVVAPTPTPMPETATPTEETAPYTPPSLTPAGTSASTPPVDPTAMLTVAPETPGTPSPTSIPDQTPTPTPDETDARVAGFASWGEMIGAVRELIHADAGLTEAVVAASDEAYPNLREAGLVPTVGTNWTRPADGMTMVYVPGGTFQMGSEDEGENERPVHEVTVDGFWLDRTEVTNAQYALCVADGDCEESRYADDADYNGDNYPVVGVTWYQAAAYCEWADAEGRLPTEAEWEYAARGEEGRKYPWGNGDPTCNLAQYNACEGNTVPVGSFPEGASWCGAFDMAGNAWEWVGDWYGEYPSGSQVNPTGPETGEYRVLRGGSWWNNPGVLRGADRGGIFPVNGGVSIGFRCARGS